MKNILLFFASPFLVKKDKVDLKPLWLNSLPLKRFLPFLRDKVDLKPTKYKFDDVYHTNESAVKYLCQKLPEKKFDKIFIFTSKKVGKPLDEEEQRVVEKVCEESSSQDNADVTENSHLYYFLKRIDGYYSDLKIVNYNEDDEIEQSLGVMMKMASAITEYKKLSGDDEVVLYADMTGGMRNASMMMLGTMRYLEYSDIKLGKIVYSNKVENKVNVEEATDVYRFFDLVAGAKDFKNYGSVYEIDNYIKQVVEKKYPSNKGVDLLSMELNALLKAMRDFSEQIKLCFYGDFINSIKNLKKCVGEFKKHVEGLETESSKNNYDYLCHCMLPTIYKEYELLFKDTADDLDYIEWCVNHGYYQQALTLYTERVPEYIFDKGILNKKENVEDIEEFRKFKEEKDNKNITFQYWILSRKETAKKEENILFCQQNIVRVVRVLFKEEYSEQEISNELENVFRRCRFKVCFGYENDGDYCNGQISDIQLKHNTAVVVAKEIFEIKNMSKKDENIIDNFFENNCVMKNLCNYVEKLDAYVSKYNNENVDLENLCKCIDRLYEIKKKVYGKSRSLAKDELGGIRKNNEKIAIIYNGLKKVSAVKQFNDELNNLKNICNVNLPPRKRAEKLLKIMENNLDINGKNLNVLDVLGINVEESYKSISWRLCKGVQELVQKEIIRTYYNCEDDWNRYLKICEIYTLIRRDMRNVTNHAHIGKSEFNAKNIQDTVLKGLALLRQEAKIVEERRNAANN